MRIEAYAQVQQIYRQSQKTDKTQAGRSTAKFTDKLQISTMGRDVQAVKAAMDEIPDIREDVTAPIKARIQNGTYEVSAGSFAEKLLQKYAEMG